MSVLAISGHPRSGTTLVRNLCNMHPEIFVTMEFRNLDGVGRSRLGYVRYILDSSWRERSRSILSQGKNEKDRRKVLKSYFFIARYLFSIYRQADDSVRLKDIERAIQGITHVKIVGDKYPNYLLKMDRFSLMDGLKIVVIYRDGRDVISSFLKQTRTNWKGRRFAMQYDSAEKLATRWVDAINIMEKYSTKAHIVRYENLVQHPTEEIKLLADYLGVDDVDFSVDMISNTNVGRYKTELSKQELESIDNVAGSTLARLDYS